MRIPRPPGGIEVDLEKIPEKQPEKNPPNPLDMPDMDDGFDPGRLEKLKEEQRRPEYQPEVGTPERPGPEIGE